MNALPRRLLTTVIIALMSMCATASAQQKKALANPLDPPWVGAPVLVGPVFGINRNFHSGGFRVIPAPDCPVFQSGSGWGFLAGLTAEFQLGESWSLIPRITYDSRPGQFHQALQDVPVMVDEGDGSFRTVNQTVSTTSTITYSLLNVEVMYKQEFWQIGKGVRIAAEAGPVFGYVLGGKNRQVQDLVLPTNARFLPVDTASGFTESSDRRTIIFWDKEIKERNPLRLAIKVGLQTEMPLFDNAWLMCPAVFYDLGITRVTEAENWSLNTLMLQVDFRRAF